jgi:hypothetical protein
MQTVISESIRSLLEYVMVGSSGGVCGGVDKVRHLSYFILTKKNHSAFTISGHMPFPLHAEWKLQKA